jgi:imidazolonepropionase-like amidohydrolase
MSIPQIKPWLPQKKPPRIYFTNAYIVDVTNGEVYYGGTVGIENGLIAVVRRHDNEDTNSDEGYDADAYVVNLVGQYICPGLIDCHVHLTANAGQATMRDLFAAHPNAIAYRTVWNAKQMLLRGFTTVRDTGGADASLRESIAEGLVPGPRLFVSGKALSQTGGHGDLRASYQGNDFKCCGGHSPGFARVCDGVPGTLEAARDELRKGADFLKIMVGGGVASPNDPLDMLQFTQEEIRAITGTAKQMNKYVTAHAYTVEAIRHAIDNGVMGIEHANFIDDDTARLCAENGITVTPTLATYKGMSEPPYEDFLPPDGRVKNKRVLESGVQALKILHDQGVNVCYGTDLLAGMHVRQNEEFAIRSQALLPLSILQSATINGAKLLGMEDKIGRIEEGFIADLLILDANPLEDITVLSRFKEHCQGTLKDGRVVFSKLEDLKIDDMYK